MQAITTKFLPCTNNRGARIKATAEAGSVTMSYNYELNHDQRHAEVAAALCKKFGWKGTLVGGGTKDGMVWVFTKGSETITVE